MDQRTDIDALRAQRRVDHARRPGGMLKLFFGAAEAAVPASFIQSSSRSAYFWATLIVIACTGPAALLHPYFSVSDLALVYMPGIVLVASRFGRGPSALASCLSVLALNFFFTPPYFTLFVDNPRSVLTLVVILMVALVISTLTARTRQQAEAALQRERRTSALYVLSRSYANTRGVEHLLSVTVQHTSSTFDGQVIMLLPDATGDLVPWGGLSGWWGEGLTVRMIFAPGQSDIGVARWVYDHGGLAGLGTDTLPGADAIYLPLHGAQGIVGVLGLRPSQTRCALSPDQLHLLETFVSQTALAFERASLAEIAQRAALQVESERLRNSLLSSVSHDLRTPLAVVTGALSSTLEGWQTLDDPTRIELIQNAYDEADRLSRLLTNLLEMTRLEAGGLTARKEWQPLEEVVGAALTRLESRLSDRPLTVDLPPDLPLVPLDAVLIEQVLVNLVENALKYTPPDALIEIAAAAVLVPEPAAVRVTVADRGPGLAPGDELSIFEKFNRGRQPAGGGVGLGLTICRGIVRAHGGQIWSERRPDGGAAFIFTLPISGTPPRVEPEDAPAPRKEDYLR